MLAVVRAGRPRTETTTTVTTYSDGRTVTVTLKKPAGDWQAAAWWLERTYPERYGSERRAICELRQQLARLEAMLAQATPPLVPEGFPRLAAAN